MSAGGAVRLKPVEYVQLYGPPAKRCTSCDHARPDLHAAGGRLDRMVLQDVAAWASWRRDSWGEQTYPSVPQIARRIGYSERSVQYALRRLERSGFLERVERPGFTAVCRVVRVVEPVDEVADVVNFSVYKRGRSRRSNTPPLHQSGATVAPELGDLPAEPPPLPPHRGWPDSSDGADAPAQAAPQWRGEAESPFGTGPPSPAGVGSEPHRQDAGRQRVPEPAAPSPGDVLAGVSALAAAPDEPGGVIRWSRRVTRLQRCPQCGAEPGAPCRNRAGRERKANHAARRTYPPPRTG